MYSMNRKSAYINIPYVNMYNVFVFNSCSFESGNDKNGHPLVFMVTAKGEFTLRESECESENAV